MLAVDFNPIDKIEFNGNNIEMVFWKGRMIWPVKVVTTPPVPAPLVLQLPDDPFHTAMQTFEVSKGQSIILKYPKNPLPAMPVVVNHYGWRHLTFGYIDKGQTYDAAFPPNALNKPNVISKLQVDVMGESAGYLLNYALLGSKQIDYAQAFNIGQFAKTQDDVVVIVRGDADVEAFYATSYSGNYGHEYNPGGILYKFVIKDNKPPPAIPPNVGWYDVDLDRLVSYASNISGLPGGDGTTMDEQYYTVPSGTNINFTITDNEASNNYDIRHFRATLGHPVKFYADDGGLQTRYAGKWILPDGLKPGTVIELKLGQDSTSTWVAGYITIV